MDPVSALGLAGTVVQFTQVAYSVLKNSKSIYDSATGQSQNSEALEVICQKFLDFSRDYQDDVPGKWSQQQSEDRKLDAGTVSRIRSHAMRDLTFRCSQDCSRLLEIVQASKVKGGKYSRWFRSIKPVLKEVFKAGEIQELRERMATYHTQMMLELCKVSKQVFRNTPNTSGSNSHTNFSVSFSNELESVGKQLSQLRVTTQDLRGHGADILDTLSKSLKQIQGQVTDIKSTAGSKDGLQLSMNDVNILTEEVSQLSRNSQKRANEHAILSQLNYTQQPTRHDGICEAHEETFRGMFDPVPERQALHRGISQWLSTGSGAFWVAGKPGSGKSTFMKYIADHGQTRRELSTWAGDKPLIMAAHYFWSAGNPIQRSHEGLLRSLLLDIFCQMPELLPDICTERWRCITGEEVNHYYESTMPWTLPELQKAMRRIAAKKCLPARICFFIDGLDEYGGDDDVLCKLIKELCRSSDMKACVASRTENIFEAYFGSDLNSKLYIQDLTREDIQIYVETTLRGLSDEKLSNFRTGDISRLAKEITERAQGVFLWVSLVTKLLMKGINNCDTMIDLRKRLESIPRDLQKLYRKLIDTVDSCYGEKMAETLLIACATVASSMHAIFYIFQEKEHENESYAIDEDLEVWDGKKVSEEIDKYKCRLNSTCNGLLEIKNGYVCFLHRTVYDYLQKDDVKDSLGAKTRETFNISFSLFQAHVATAKHQRIQFLERESSHSNSLLVEIWCYLEPILREARDLTLDESSVSGRISVRNILDDLESAIHRKVHLPVVYAQCEQIEVRDFTERTAVGQFRILAIDSGLYEYVKAKIEQDKDYLEGLPIPPLSCTLGVQPRRCCAFHTSIRQPLPHQLDFLHYLLMIGHSPNEVYSYDTAHPEREMSGLCEIHNSIHNSIQFTPWSKCCEGFIRTLEFDKDSIIASICFQYTDTLALFLKFGADPNAQCFDMPIWAHFMLWVFEMELFLVKSTFDFEGASDYITWSNSFLHLIEVVLSTADFQVPAVGLQDMVKGFLKKTKEAASDPPQPPISENEFDDEFNDYLDFHTERPHRVFTQLQAQNRPGSQRIMNQEQARVSMMKLLWLKLHSYRRLRLNGHFQNDLLSSRWPEERKKTEHKSVSLDAGVCYQYSSLIMRAIAKFLNHASLPKSSAQILERKAIETFPSSVLMAAAIDRDSKFKIGDTQSIGIVEEVDLSIPNLM